MYHYYHDPSWLLSIIIITLLYIYIYKFTKLDHCSLEPHGDDWGSPRTGLKPPYFSPLKTAIFFTPAERDRSCG